MTNLAEQHDEEHGAQLADAEISSILSALQKAEFKRSETGYARPDQNFKPRSLMEIAETVGQQDEDTEAIIITSESAADKAADETDQAIEVKDDAVPKITEVNPLHAEQSGGVSDHGPQDTSLEISSTEFNTPDLKVPTPINPGKGADAEVNNGAENITGPTSLTSTFETAQAAYERGCADGLASGREAAESELRATIAAEFEAKFSDKISAFEKALIGLAKPQTVDIGALSRSLHEAIIRLAAARTGTVIDELPEIMVSRIESLADTAGKNVAAGQVFMHPDDCAVIAPVLAARQDPVMIEADLALQRGDIRIRFDGMDITDIADLRADWKITKQSTHENTVNAKPFASGNIVSELETQSSENLNEGPKAASSPSNITPSPKADGNRGKSSEGSTERNEGTSEAETVGLMPLTTTGGGDTVSHEEAEESEGTSETEAVGLMPLTTTSVEDPKPDK